MAPDLEFFNEAFKDAVPHNRALGMRVVEVELDQAAASIELDWAEHLVGNPETQVIHGGVITTLIDACSGLAVYLRLQEPMPIATLDLRIDYLKPATPRRPVRARAECFKATHNVAFVRAVAFHDDPKDPIASSAGTFMLGTQGRSVTTVKVPPP
jgi:uncharacterized protein (TIGR00369 family)